MKASKVKNQLSFEFCDGCGDYIRPDEGKVVVLDGGKVVLCPDCASRGKQDTESIVAAFEKKYNL